MFVRQNQQQFRNSNADVQIFYGSDGNSNPTFAWNKPPGVSHIYILAIGGGAPNFSGSGGGSGAISVWYGAAQNVPDSLQIRMSDNQGGTNTAVSFRNGSSTVNLVVALGSGSSTGAAASGAGIFAASGFYQSIAGQNGNSGPISASTTTFLSGGGGGVGNTVTANYEYSTAKNGFFMFQPIIVGCGGVNDGNPGIGCGGGSTSTVGGQGMVLIASW
jgi:hypothetical protein